MPQLIASIEGVVFKHVTLAKPRTTLGRRPYNDIVFENLVCSGEHCAFHMADGEVEVQDLESTNGTSVNGKKVERCRLKNGDTVGIGRYRIQYLASSPEDGYQRTDQLEVADGDDPGDGTATVGIDAGGGPGAVFRILSGSSAGLEVPVVKSVTTFGKHGVCIVAVSHRRNGFFVAHLEGEQRPTLNGIPFGDAIAMADGDVLDLAGTRMEFSVRS